MRLKETKEVSLFKFTNDKSALINIYVEPTEPGQGRLIISTQYHIFQRFFDGCNPDIFTFLSKQTAEMICGCFDISDEPFPPNKSLTYYDYLQKSIAGVWPLFIEAVKFRLNADNAPDSPNEWQLTIKIEQVEDDKFNSSTTFPNHAKANMVVNQLRACADVIENQIIEKVKTLDPIGVNIDDAFEIVRKITIGDLL